jgi:hypothetical protein
MCSCSAFRLTVGSLVRPAPKLEVADTYAASCRRCVLAALLMLVTLCVFAITAYYFRTSPQAVPTVTPLSLYAPHCQGLSRPQVASSLFSTVSESTTVDPNGVATIRVSNATCQLTYSVAAGQECDAHQSYDAVDVNATITYGAQVCNTQDEYVRSRANFTALVDSLPFTASLSCSTEFISELQKCPPRPSNQTFHAPVIYYSSADILNLDGKRLACIEQDVDTRSFYTCYAVSLRVVLPRGLIDCVRPSD